MGPWFLRHYGVPTSSTPAGFFSFFRFWGGGGGSSGGTTPGVGNIIPYRRHRRRGR